MYNSELPSKRIYKITDLFGRKTLKPSNQLHIYIFNDGSAEKRKIIY
jgi:hypothetical protein